MKKVTFLLLVFLVACGQEKSENTTQITSTSVSETPTAFMPELTPPRMIIHSGTFSPDLKAYYYTLSDAGFERFDVKVIRQSGNTWSEPQDALFNTNYNEHGTQFSPDGRTIYFTSTRPTDIEGMPPVWHLWQTVKTEKGWSEPTLIDIPNLRDKSVSHPSITSNGMLYFHASQPDYSEMTLYRAQLKNGKPGSAEKLRITANSLACTPYVSADGQLLIYAAIGESLDLMISRKDKDGTWGTPETLPESINTHGQGNPYLTPDGEFLYFTTGTQPQAGQNPDWQVKRVRLTDR